MKWNYVLAVLLTTFLIVQPIKAASLQEYVPTDGWRSVIPENVGMDSTVLAGMYDYIEANDLDMHSVVVIKNGYIVEEAYPNPSYDQNRRHVINSCTKSIISALIGIAIHEGYISSVDQKILDFFPDREIGNFDAQKQALTIEHFLTMTSGLEWDEWPAN